MKSRGDAKTPPVSRLERRNPSLSEAAEALKVETKARVRGAENVIRTTMQKCFNKAKSKTPENIVVSLKTSRTL